MLHERAVFPRLVALKIMEHGSMSKHRDLTGPRPAGNHKELIVWQKAVDLALSAHQISATFPTFELFGLGAQIRGAAISIPSNIAEGAARGSAKELLRFLYIARGSCAELETQLHIAHKLGYLASASEIEKRVAEVGKLLTSIIGTLRHQVSKP